MRPAMKVVMFFVMLFLIGMVYNLLNNWGVNLLTDTIANQSSLPQNPYPTVTTVYSFLWMAIPVIGIISTALYIALEGRGGTL